MLKLSEEKSKIIKTIVSATIIGFKNNFENVDTLPDSDEDEIDNLHLILLKSRGETPVRIDNYVKNVIMNLPSNEFQTHFRMPFSAFENLLAVLGPLLNESDNNCHKVEAKTQILAVIWLLATPESYRSVGDRFNLAKSTLFQCFKRVVNGLCKISPTIIKWPSVQEIGCIKEGFKKMSGIPNIIGAIDGSYIPIKAPRKDSEVYINRKCFYAITLQGICDNSLRFIDCFAGYPSSVSDIRILRNSDIYRSIINNMKRHFPEDEFLIGDKAYPVLPWLIPPYMNRGTLTQTQTTFNIKLSQSRSCIERSFALLKGRFRRLKYLDMNCTELIPYTVLACCVLHNICINTNDGKIYEYIEEGGQPDDISEDSLKSRNENDVTTHEGKVKRDLLAHALCRTHHHNTE